VPEIRRVYEENVHVYGVRTPVSCGWLPNRARSHRWAASAIPTTTRFNLLRQEKASCIEAVDPD